MAAKETPTIWSALAAAVVAFTAAAVIAILMSVREPVFPVRIPGVQGFVDTKIDLAWIGALLLIGVMIWLVISRARFFVLGSAILGGEAGFQFFDLANIRIPLPNGNDILIEVSRNTDWRVHLGLVVAGVFFVWLDHKRRPTA